MNLLVSFVNQYYSPQLCLGIIDLNTGDFFWIYDEPIAHATKNVLGVNGLYSIDNKIIVGYQSNPTKILVLNSKDFSIIKDVEIPNVIDLHSFAYFEGNLYCVSTGTDEVIKIKFDNDYNIVNTEVYWDTGHSGRDNYHVNSIAIDEDKIYVTFFGKKHEKGWKETLNGGVINLKTREIIFEDLHHPHTIFFSNNQAILCESGKGNIVFLNKKMHRKYLGGYLRGIAENEDYLFVGSSGKRLISRSEGTVNLDPTKNEEEAKSFIYWLKKPKMEILKKIELSYFGTEIYDLLFLENSINKKNFTSTNPLFLRIKHMEHELVTIKGKLAEQSKQKSSVLKSTKKFIKRIIS